MALAIRRTSTLWTPCTRSLARIFSTLADGGSADASVSPPSAPSAADATLSRGYNTAAAAATAPPMPDVVQLGSALEQVLVSSLANAPTARARPESLAHPEMYGALLAQTQQPVTSARTLHREMYTSQPLYEVEAERVLERSWFCVGHVSQVASHGDTFPARVGSQPIFVTRTKKGELKAYFNVCRHRGSKLVRSAGRYPAIVCPYHRWGYSLEGRLVATPMWEDESKVDPRTKAAFEIPEDAGFNKKEHSLLPVDVDTWAGQIFVNVSGNAPPLRDYLGRIVDDYEEMPMADLVPYRSAQFDCSANWKMLMENFLEYYHLPAVHPALCDVSVPDQHVRLQGHGMYMGFATDPISDGGTPIDPSALPTMPGVVRGAKRAIHSGVFPNVFWSAYNHSVFTVRLQPISATRTLEHTELYVHPTVLERPELKEKLDAAWDFFFQVNSEDVAIVNELAEGLQARAFNGGTYSFKFEEPLHRFHNMVAQMMMLRDGEEVVVPPGDDERYARSPEERSASVSAAA